MTRDQIIALGIEALTDIVADLPQDGNGRPFVPGRANLIIVRADGYRLECGSRPWVRFGSSGWVVEVPKDRPPVVELEMVSDTSRLYTSPADANDAMVKIRPDLHGQLAEMRSAT